MSEYAQKIKLYTTLCKQSVAAAHVRRFDHDESESWWYRAVTAQESLSRWRRAQKQYWQHLQKVWEEEL